MRYRWLRVLGKYSYGIYVYHWLVQYCLVKLNLAGLRGSSPWLIFGLVSMITAGTAWASYHLLERPFLSLKRYARFDDAG